MPWFNVDDSFYDHPKVFDAPDCAVALWSRAGSWSSRNLTDGFVPAKMPARLCDDPEAAVRELLDRRLWQRTKGGYLFHDWTDWNPSAEEVRRRREQNAERQRRYRAAKNGAYPDLDVTHDITQYVTRDKMRDKRVSRNAQSNPIQSPLMAEVVDHLSRRFAPAREDDDLLKVVIDSIHQRTKQVINGDRAAVIADEILSGQQVKNPRAYVQTAILREPNPVARWLSDMPAAAPPEPEPCGKCNPQRRREDPVTGADLGPCPDCHPSRARAS